MTEKIKNDSEKSAESNQLMQRSVAAALTVVLAGGGVAIGQHIHQNETSDSLKALTEQPMTAEQIETLKKQLRGQFPESAQVGEPFTLEEGRGYLNKSVEQVSNAYDEEIARTSFDQLRTAAMYQVTPQPDGTYVVVEVDSNNDGVKEFFPVSTSQIIHEGDIEIPTPVTH